MVKPSDKNKFTREFLDKLKFAELRKKSKDLYDLFGLRNDRPTDLMIPLEKLLQVLLAFQKDGYAAFTKKNSVLKPNSPMYKDFSMNIETFFTIDNMINLYMLYNKAEIEKKESDDKRTPIPYYVIGFVGQIFKDKTFDEVNDKLYDLFSAKDKLYVIYEFCKNLTAYYSEEYCRENQSDYNKMIKQEIDYPILDRCIHNQLRFSSDNQEVKDFFRI